MEDRLLRFLDTEQISSSKFADIIGVQRSSVSHILSGRNKPSFDFLQKTLKAFSMLNADWLILGEGKMYKGDVDISGGTLFDQPVRQQPDAEDSTGESVTKPENVPKEFNILKNQVDTNDSGSSSNVIKETLSVTLNQSEKEVARLIVLYADKTFDSYEQS